MIVVTVTLSDEKVIETIRAVGHAGLSLRGTDIACAAFTVLLRTFLRTVEAAPGVVWSVREDVSEAFEWRASRVSLAGAAVYRGWCEFLLRGLEDLQGEIPQAVQLHYELKTGRLFHGS